MLAIMLVLLSAILVALVIHILYRRRQLRLQEEGTRIRGGVLPEESEDVIALRIQRRYETIEGWMISKRVMRHDDFCAECVHGLATGSSGKVSSDLPTSESSCHSGASPRDKYLFVDLEASSTQSTSNTIECPICLDEFKLGQIISYSPNTECNHVFHHECIKEWLLRHTNCPFCRNFCMHTDLIRGKQHNSDVLSNHMTECLRRHSQRLATSLFCETMGLISIPSKVNCTERELAELTSRIKGSVVDRTTLAKYRKSNPDTRSGSRKSDPQDGSDRIDWCSSRERSASLDSQGSLPLSAQVPAEVIDDNTISDNGDPMDSDSSIILE